MKLAYEAMDDSGAMVRDVIESASIEEASDSLRARGLFVTEIIESAKGKSSRKPATPGVSLKIGGSTKRLRQVAMFSRQLQMLVATGTPIADAMAALQRQTREVAFEAVIGDMRQHVEQGAALSEAMSLHPQYFDQVYRNVVVAGESAGALDTMLDRLAMLTRKQAQIRNQVLGAMVYPAVLVSISLGVLVIMLMLVMPRFAGLFESLDVPLPATTEALMWASGFLRSYWWAVLLVLGAALGGGMNWARTPAGKARIDRIMVFTPKLGAVTRSFASARIARLLGVLVECNVPLLDAIQLSRHATANSLYVELMSRAEASVISGEPMSNELADDRLIEPSLYEAARNGEMSGKLGPLMVTVADFLDEENDVRIRSLTSLIEPLILVLLGVMVGGMAISMFLPLFDLTAGAGGGPG